MATFSFQRVLVWDVNPGGTLRTLRNGQVTVKNAATDAVIDTVTSDPNGMVTFTTTDVPTVYLVSPSGLVSEHITAASAVEASAAFTVSEDAAVAALVADGSPSSTRAALDSVYAALPADPAEALDIYFRGPTNIPGWTTSEEVTARALGWVIATDAQYAGGAKGDKTTPNHAAIQAAIDHAKTLVRDTVGRQEDGVTVWLGKGMFLLESGVLCDTSCISVAGAGQSDTVLYAPNATFDLLTFSHASVSLYNCGVRNLRFSTPGNATGGYHLKASRCINFTASNLYFNGWFGGLYLAGVGKWMGSQLIFSQETRTSGTTAEGIKIDSSAFLSSDIHLTDVQIVEDVATAGATAFLLTSVDGLYVTNLHMHGGFLINPSNTGNETTVASVVFTNCYFDSAASAVDCFGIQGTASTAYRKIKFVNCDFRNGLRGLRVEASSVVERLQIANCSFSDNQRNGIDVRNANLKDSRISSSVFSGNNTANGAGWGDLNVSGDGVSLNGLTFSGGGATGYSLAIASAATDIGVTDIDFTNSTVASKVVNSAGTQTKFKGIRGWLVKNKGAQAVGSGVTTSVVTHGLNLTPTLEAIRLTPGASCPAFWVTGVTSTQFTINFASATSSAFTMGWLVDMES